MTEHVGDEHRLEDDEAGQRGERLAALAELFGADSDRIRTPIPIESVHPFRGFRTLGLEAGR